MHNENLSTDDTLGPLNKVIPKVIDDEKNPATYTRWATRGIAGPDGTRIRLEVWYAGREPRTTIAAVQRFVTAVTEARLARMQRNQNKADDVTDEELAAVGLTTPKMMPSPRNNPIDSDDLKRTIALATEQARLITRVRNLLGPVG